jgi:hypothetical protein
MSGFVSPRHGASSGCGWRNGLQYGDWVDPGVDWRIILRWIFRKWDVGIWTGMSWLNDKYRWRVLVNAVMNIRVL